MKNKKIYKCSNCGVTSAKWQGRCYNCDAWDSFVEVKSSSSKTSSSQTLTKPIFLDDINSDNYQRFKSSINEFDRVLGGGIVPGSLTLLGGDPGIGKSTLMLQLINQLDKLNPLYVSGEESAGQIKSRAERLLNFSSNSRLLIDNSLESIIDNLKNDDSKLCIIDSIQSIQSDEIDSPAGSVVQIRECTYRLMQKAKELNKSIILIGHITKEGSLAGPKLLEHLVDAVLQFEGDINHQYRIIRSIKNRYGSTGEIGVFEMTSKGLIEIENPSDLFLQSYSNGEAGVAVTATIEGSRPLLAEIQALVTPTGFSIPQRSTNGYDLKRLNMIISVLEKRLGTKFFKNDVFINVTGGLNLQDPGVDLALIAALLSSFHNKAIPKNTIFFGEAGLTGELRSVQFPDKRINEAEKMGFEKIITPKLKLDKSKFNIELMEFDRILLAINHIFN